MTFLRNAMALALALLAFAAHAEIYMDLRPGDSVTAVRTKYPNASMVDMKPAWLLSNESFKALTGSGISGTIYLKFSTTDSYTQSKIDKLVKEILAEPQADNSNKEFFLGLFVKQINLPLDERLTIDWVRWIPPTALPLQRFESKYGKPEKCDYKSDTFEPYCAWASKGVSATLNDAKTMATMLDFQFTAAEWGAASGLPVPLPNVAPSTSPKSPQPLTIPASKTRRAM